MLISMISISRYLDLRDVIDLLFGGILFKKHSPTVAARIDRPTSETQQVRVRSLPSEDIN